MFLLMLFRSSFLFKQCGSTKVTLSATFLAFVWQRNDVTIISIRFPGGNPIPDRPEPMSGILTGCPFEYSRIPFQTPAKQVQRSCTVADAFSDARSVCDKATKQVALVIDVNTRDRADCVSVAFPARSCHTCLFRHDTR